MIGDEGKILIYPRQNIGRATSILHVRRFAMDDTRVSRIIRYDRTLLKSVPIKGSARKWRKLRAKGHTQGWSGTGSERSCHQRGLFSGSSHKRPGSRTRKGAREAWRINKPARCFANTTNQTDTSHRRSV